MDKEKFKEMSRELIPLIEKILEIGKKYGLPEDKLSRIAFSMDGYFCLEATGTGYELYQSNHGGTVKIRLPEEVL